MITQLEFPFKVGSLNQIYDKVFNCISIKPPYEGEDSMWGDNFFLDKRKGFSFYKDHSGYIYTDKQTINGVDYYLYNNGTQSWLGYDNGTTITQVAGPFAIDSTTPVKFVQCFGAGGVLRTSGTISTSISGTPTNPDLQYYGDGWIKLTLSSVTGVTNLDYIQFTDGVLKGGANQILEKTGSDIYIIGTNTRGTLPLVGAGYKVFSKKSKSVIIPSSSGLYLISFGTLPSDSIEQIQLSTKKTIDLVTFNNVIFHLTEEGIYFSRKTFDDNIQFYPLDRFPTSGLEKLIDLGKVLVGLGVENKIYAPATGTDETIGYVEYNLSYNGTLFSKYSYLYFDNTFYIYQKDKQLFQVNLVTVNPTTYDLQLQSVDNSTRGLFESITNGVMFANGDDRYVNFINKKTGSSDIYQYDKQYKHWFIHSIPKEVYYYSSNRMLINGGVAQQYDGYEDFGTPYEQEVNLMIEESFKMIMPLFIRTLFGLTSTDKINVPLTITHHEGPELVVDNKLFGNYYFDTDLTNIEISDLTGYEEQSKYTGNTVSLQHSIFKTGRFFKFKFKSEKRFILGPSYIEYTKVKHFINEILQTN